MKAPTRRISATKLRAKCGALLARVHKTGIEIAITSRQAGREARRRAGRIRGDIVYVNLWEPAR